MASASRNDSRGFDPLELLQFSPLVPLVPVGGALVHFAARPKSWSKPMRWALAAATTLTALNLARWQMKRHFTPKPKYEVLAKLGPLEIRRYEPMVLAQTEVEGGFDEALDEGFSRLAAFIYGDNSRANQPYENERLSMTAPVTAGESQAGLRTVSFVMPPGKRLSELPQPYDPRIQVKEQPSRIVAALLFRGRYNAERVQSAERELMELVSAKGLKARSAPVFAGYDAPSILPALRRNEVWVELDA